MFSVYPSLEWAGIAQSVWPLDTGWTIRGSNPGAGEIFRTRTDRPWGPTSLLCHEYPFLPGGEAAQARRSHTQLSSAEVKERVEVDLFPSMSSWRVIRRYLLYLYSSQDFYADS